MQHQAQRVNVALDRHGTTSQLLGRHVGRRPNSIARRVFHVGQPCQTEIGDPHLSTTVEHDVGRFQVPVQHALLMSRVQSPAQLAGNVDTLVRRQSPDPSHQSTQIFTVDKLHRQKVHPFDFPDVVHATDIGMGHLAGQSDLVVQQFQPLRIVGQCLGQELQGHRLPQLQVISAVDLAHAPLSQQSDDPVTFVKYRAGDEATVGRGGQVERRQARRGLGRRRQHNGRVGDRVENAVGADRRTHRSRRELACGIQPRIVCRDRRLTTMRTEFRIRRELGRTVPANCHRSATPLVQTRKVKMRSDNRNHHDMSDGDFASWEAARRAVQQPMSHSDQRSRRLAFSRMRMASSSSNR